MEHLDLVPSEKELLELIVEAENSRKIVWTAGMVLKRAALIARWQQLDYAARKRVLNSITDLLETFAARGILQRRLNRQSIGFGSEIGFDYIPAVEDSI